MSNKKTILQVVPALVSGGVERGTIEIAKFLKESGYNSIVVSAGGCLMNKLIKLDIQHINVNVMSKNPFTMWRNIKLIQDVIKNHNVDVVHARSRAPAWSSYRATQNSTAKFITTFHGIYNFSGWFKKYYNSIMTKGEVVIAVSNFVKQHMLENYNIPEDKINVVYRGVDYKYLNKANISNDTLLKYFDKYQVIDRIPVILLPARMTHWKGQMVLVEALNLIKHLDFYCIMAGDLSKHPNFVQRIKDRILDCKLQSKIQIFGNEIDMRGLYGIADIVLSTSIKPEAFGRTIIEAQAMEKLVIATNVGGTAETITEGVTGYHVQPSSAKDLAEKISYCLSIFGGDKANQITSAARQSVIENFSLDLMLKKNLEIYKNIMGSK
jgi:glycosyltransferase involved in cell wall biosynthesis